MGFWAQQLTEPERTKTAKELMKHSQPGTLDGLVSEVAIRGVDRVDLADHLAGEMTSATSQTARQRVVEIVELLEFSTYEETRPLAAQASAMLHESGSKAFIEDAARLLAVIGTTHRMKGAIQSQIGILDKRDLLNTGAKRALKRADYQLPKKKRSRIDPLDVIGRFTRD